MTPSTLDISWLAITCNFAGADIYLGLTAGIDDVVAHALKASQMAAFPFQTIKIATNDSKEVPLRVYAVRDPAIVRVHTIPGPAPAEGFHRVRLDFRIPLVVAGSAANPTAAEAKCNGAPETLPTKAVMAFLLTIGLPIEQEDEFYSNVVNDFLQKSWMTMPSLLREIGCMTPTQVAHGEPQTSCNA